MTKIIGVWWFDNIGIVVTENDIKERRAYIKLVDGVNIKTDIEDIADNGSLVFAHQLQEIIFQLKNK